MKYINGNGYTAKYINGSKTVINRITGNTYTAKYNNAKVGANLRKFITDIPIVGRGRVGHAIVA